VIVRAEQFYGGSGAQTDVATIGRATGQRAIVVSLGGRLGF
jgi:hypothetical protein